MRMQPASHKVHLPHQDLFDKANMLSRGQTITNGIDEARAVDIILKPGEMSLHNVRIAHASAPNRSGDRRIGISIRYMPPQTRQQLAEWDSAALVRGEDRYEHFVHEPSPQSGLRPCVCCFSPKNRHKSPLVSLQRCRWTAEDGVSGNLSLKCGAVGCCEGRNPRLGIYRGGSYFVCGQKISLVRLTSFSSYCCCWCESPSISVGEIL